MKGRVVRRARDRLRKWKRVGCSLRPRVILCCTESDFTRAVKDVGGIPLSEWGAWVTPGCLATCHNFTSAKMGAGAIIGINPSEFGPSKPQFFRMVDTLVHEAYHAAVGYMRDVGIMDAGEEVLARVHANTAGALIRSFHAEYPGLQKRWERKV